MTTHKSRVDDAERSPLPLRLCEVLEHEYAAIHGHSDEASSWLLEPLHIGPSKLLDVLSGLSASAYPAAVTVIRQRLEHAGLSVSGDAAADPSIRTTLCQRLNQLLLSAEPPYDYRLLAHHSGTWQIGEALAAVATTRSHVDRAREAAEAERGAPEADRGHRGNDDLTLFNRLLLEEAFPPEAIARTDNVRLDRVFQRVHASRGTEGILSALCLSGGGIRSASFALGVLQSLARAGILERFDFLSTVSGGGYIGSWLSTWIHRHPRGLAGVIADLGPHADPEAGGITRKLLPEVAALRFLRSYSHFLNPKAGLFSADTWTWIGIYLRNLTLNWLIIIPLLLLLIVLPRLYASFVYDAEFAQGNAFPWLVWLATAAVVLTLVCVTVNRPSISDPARPPRGVSATQPNRLQLFLRRFKLQGWVLTLGVAPLLVFALIASLLIWTYRDKGLFSLELVTRWLEATPLHVWPLVLAYVGVEHLLIWGEISVLLGWLIAIALLPSRDWSKRLTELVAMLGAGFLTWALVSGLAGYAVGVARDAKVALHVDKLTIYPAHLYAILAVPTIVIAVLLGMTLFIGAASKFKWIEDEDREWWGRFGAWVLICVVAWVALAGVAIYGPLLLLASPKLVGAVGGVSGLVAIILGKSSLTAATGQTSAAAAKSRPQGVVAMLGVNALTASALVFLAAFLAFLSLLVSVALGHLFAQRALDPSASEVLRSLGVPETLAQACGLGTPWDGWSQIGVFRDGQIHLELVCQTPARVVGAVILALALLLVVASSLINLNKFSLHAAYRIRIVRTFLGASRRGGREPNPFTGFDPLDNLQMHELQPGLLREADVSHLPGFVQKLRQALLGHDASEAARWLVQRMCTAEHDPSGVLESRLRHAEPDRPVLKSLERSLFQSLNRVLETARLHEAKEFAQMNGADRAGFEVALKQYVEHGNVVFANRLLLQGAFPGDIRPYEFPPPPPHKLVHVLNLTLNLVHGKTLAWQERKAAPFAVTPMHCGSYYLGYRPSRDFGGKDGISIGTAAAISGAAVSPNMGYSSSPVTSLLLTMFNVRLGWWLGNSGIAGNDTYRLAEPRLSLRPLLAEALGMTDDQSPYIYLSDGGHFENLGLFEMVLRRCRLIVVSDAGADPEYQFEDLANAVRKIRVDLGIPIEFATMPIRKRGTPEDNKAGRYAALGRIRYGEIDGPNAADGMLILIKPTVYGREPQDVRMYAAQRSQFPQESTADQFFGEAQFESYRQLGAFETQRIFFGDTPSAPGGTAWAANAIRSLHEHLGCAPDRWVEAWLERI